MLSLILKNNRFLIAEKSLLQGCLLNLSVFYLMHPTHSQKSICQAIPIKVKNPSFLVSLKVQLMVVVVCLDHSHRRGTIHAVLYELHKINQILLAKKFGCLGHCAVMAVRGFRNPATTS